MAHLLAKLVLKAAQIHEEAYDKEASDAAVAATAAKNDQALAEHKEKKGSGLVMWPVTEYVDFAQFQTKNMAQCASEACADHPDYAMPVYLLLQQSWNDALDWAKKIDGK